MRLFTLKAVIFTVLGFALLFIFSKEPTKTERGYILNCSDVVPANFIRASPSNTQLEVLAPSLSPEEKLKFEQALCASLSGARLVARSLGEEASWLQSLPVEVRDVVEGSNKQAVFERSLANMNLDRKMSVATAMIREYSNEQLVWVLGHELGHGVLEHHERKAYVRVVSALLALAGLMAIMFFPSRLSRAFREAKSRGETVSRNAVIAFMAAAVLGGVMLIFGVPIAVCGPAYTSYGNELEADTFGVRAAQFSGLKLNSVKDGVLSLFQASPRATETCFDKFPVNDNVHPSSEIRADAIQALK